MERPNRRHQQELGKAFAALVEVEEGLQGIGLRDRCHGEGC